MTKRVIIGYEEQQRLHERFIELMSHVKPIAQDVACINLMKKVKPAMEFNRLVVKNMGLKNEKPWRAKRYKAQKDAIHYLESYVNQIKS